MPKRDPLPQTELEFTDFVYAQQSQPSEAPEERFSSETLSPEVRKALADGLQQVEAGRFADEKIIELILRRAGA